MFKNYLIILMIIILLLFLYINNSEHFAGALTTQNAEAVANISSMVNSGNLKVTNLEVTNNLSVNKNINLPRAGSSINYASDDPVNFHIKYSDEMDGLRVSSWGGGDFRTKYGGDKRILWWNTGGVGMTDLHSNNIRNTNDIYNSNNIYAKNLCIGATCLNEDHLKMLTGQKEIALKNKSTDHWIGKQRYGGIASLSNVKPSALNNEEAANAGAFYITSFF